jgi:hypothetical protein
MTNYSIANCSRGSRFFFVAFLLLFAMSAVAKEKPEWRSWPMGDRLFASVGWFKPKLDTQVGISNSAGNLGALINFESSLGLADSKSTVLGGMNWRISKRNSLSFNYFKLDRSATQGDGITITIGDETFEPAIDFPIASFFDIEAFNLLYSFSVIRNPKHELALGLGVSFQDLSFGVEQTPDCGLPPCDRKSEVFSSTAPLPTLNARYQYAINDKWIIVTSLGWLAVSADLASDEKLSGEIWNVDAGIRWKTWKNVGFSLLYNYFDVDVDYDKRNLKATAIYKYQGPILGINAYF